MQLGFFYNVIPHVYDLHQQQHFPSGSGLIGIVSPHHNLPLDCN